MLELLEIPLVEMNGGGNLLENGDVGQFFHWLAMIPLCILKTYIEL